MPALHLELNITALQWISLSRQKLAYSIIPRIRLSQHRGTSSPIRQENPQPPVPFLHSIIASHHSAMHARTRMQAPTDKGCTPLKLDVLMLRWCLDSSCHYSIVYEGWEKRQRKREERRGMLVIY